ncbi:MAG TPA: hypothetical protein VL147_09085 [Devosia sp.]|nr:hypothetical protein [Devosia sp.]
MSKPLPTEGDDATEAGTVRRIANLIDTMAIDCSCRGRLADALMRFANLERRRQALRYLTIARHQRDVIVSLLDLLKEIDEFYATEGEESVYEEAAMLFDDVAAAAIAGAASMRRLAGDARTDAGQPAH